MIDELHYSGDDSTVTGFVVPAEHLFVKDGLLREPGIIENIAQTAAARAGYESQINGKTPPIGFIGDVSKLTIQRLPPIGGSLRTKVSPIQQVFDITLVKAIVEDELGIVAECEMKIVIKQAS